MTVSTTPPSFHLGVIAAMDEEFVLIAKSFGCATGSSVRSIGPRDFLSTTSGSVSLTLVRSRIGKVAAASTATILLHTFGVDAILFTGVAGGTHPTVAVGDFVVADHLVQHDMDLKGVLGYERFEIPLLGGAKIATCPKLLQIAQEAAQAVTASKQYQESVAEFCHKPPAVHTGTIASGDTFISSSLERDTLSALIPSLLCVEMEGAAVAQVCAEHNVPYAVTRIISDSANDSSFVDFPRFITNAASVGSEMLVKHVIEMLQ